MQKGFVTAGFPTNSGILTAIGLNGGHDAWATKKLKLWRVNIHDDCHLTIGSGQSVEGGIDTTLQTINGPVSDGLYTIEFPKPAEFLFFELGATGTGSNRNVVFEYALYDD